MHLSAHFVASFALVTTDFAVGAATVGMRAALPGQAAGVQIKRAVHARPTTVPLPATFLQDGAGAADGKTSHYSLTYTHGVIVTDGNASVAAVAYGVANLQPALEAAIHEAATYPATAEPGTRFNMTTNQLSLIIKPSATASRPLMMNWQDFAAILQVLLNDTQHSPSYQTLFLGVVRDQNGISCADVAILPQVVFAHYEATPINPINSTSPAISIPVSSATRQLQDQRKEDGNREASNRRVGLVREFGANLWHRPVWRRLDLSSTDVTMHQIRTAMRNIIDTARTTVLELLDMSNPRRIVNPGFFVPPAFSIGGGSWVDLSLVVLRPPGSQSGDPSLVTVQDMSDLLDEIRTLVQGSSFSNRIPRAEVMLLSPRWTNVVRWAFTFHHPSVRNETAFTMGRNESDGGASSNADPATSDPANAGTGNPETGNPEMGNAGMGSAGTGSAGTGSAGTGNARSGNPGSSGVASFYNPAAAESLISWALPKRPSACALFASCITGIIKTEL